MKQNTNTLPVISLFKLVLLMAGAFFLLFPNNKALAQTAPPAGSLIGNQASATYLDAGSNLRTVTSNVVNTVVDQVASVTIEAPLSRVVSPGGQVNFPHTITNNGNGADVFDLTMVETGAFSFTSLDIFADANSDGIPDNFTPITSTPSIPVGGAFNIVVVANVPTTATSGQSNQLTVTATSQFDNTINDDVIDDATISNNAVITLVKNMSNNTGAPGSGPYTVTLTYTNTGNATSPSLTISDLLPADMAYVAGSGRWSETGTTALTDAAGAEGASPNIVYDFNVTTAGAVVATIDNVAPSQSGSLTFQVNIAAGATPGILTNTATVEYNDGTGTTEGPDPSNDFNFTVEPTFDVSGTGDTIADAPQGSTVIFDNVITNDGNVSDRFNVTVVSNTFPAGSSFILFKPDGVSPLLDTNSDGIPDTGPLAVGASFTVKVQVSLPTSTSGGGPYILTKRATSIGNPTKFADMPDELTTIDANSIDVTVDKDIAGGAAAAEGFGAGPEGTAVKTNNTNAGTTTRFTLFVNNTSSQSDNFDLALSTDPTFATISLPTGWSVTFRNSAETVVTNTGTVNSGASFQVFADITIPAGQAATIPAISTHFRARSPVTGAADVIHLAVNVNLVRDLAISPNNSGQVFPGGTVIYVHTITNNGNITENDPGATEPSTLTLTVANGIPGFSSILYLDNNADGAIDGGDVVISSPADLGVFAPGQSKQIINRVTSTTGVTQGQNNTSTLTLAVAGVINGVAAPADKVATDITTVIDSNIIVTKRQAKDANGDGTAEGSFVTAQLNGKPGEGILYQITISNLGTVSVTNVEINDAIPPFTAYNATNAAVATTKGTASFDSGAQTITAAIGTLAPGESAVVTFGVLIDN